MKKLIVLFSLSLFGISAHAQAQCIQGRLSKICPGDEVAILSSDDNDFNLGIYRGLRDYHPTSLIEDDGKGYAEVHLYYSIGTSHVPAEQLLKIEHTCVEGFCPGHEYRYPNNYNFQVLRIFENGDAYIHADGRGKSIVSLAAMSRRIAYENSASAKIQ